MAFLPAVAFVHHLWPAATNERHCRKTDLSELVFNRPIRIIAKRVVGSWYDVSGAHRRAPSTESTNRRQLDVRDDHETQENAC
jgi:hypothetical protein